MTEETQEQKPVVTAEDQGLSDGTEDEAQGSGATDDTNIDTQIDALINNATRKDGKLQFPEGTSPELAAAARATIRFRDIQSKSTKDNARLAALEKNYTQTQKVLEENAEILLTEDQKGELADLKDSGDLDGWFNKRQEMVKDAMQKMAIDSAELSELDKMENALNAYNQKAENKDFQLSQSVLENDIPPRITKKYENKEIDFETYLSEAGAYLRLSKKVGDTQKSQNTPDLSTAPGTHKPDEGSVAVSTDQEYETKDIF